MFAFFVAAGVGAAVVIVIVIVVVFVFLGLSPAVAQQCDKRSCDR